MAVCIYNKMYGDVARNVALKTWVSGVFCGFNSAVTRQVFKKGGKSLEEMEGFGNNLQMDERSLFWKAAVNYLGRKIDSSYPFDRQDYRI